MFSGDYMKQYIDVMQSYWFWETGDTWKYWHIFDKQ